MNYWWIAFFVLLGLKVSGFIAWSWWVVFLPLIIYAILAIGTIVIVGLFMKGFLKRHINNAQNNNPDGKWW